LGHKPLYQVLARPAKICHGSNSPAETCEAAFRRDPDCSTLKLQYQHLALGDLPQERDGFFVMIGVWLKFASEPGLIPTSADVLREAVMQACAELAVQAEHISLCQHSGGTHVALFLDVETWESALVSATGIGSLVAVRVEPLVFEGLSPIL